MQHIGTPLAVQQNSHCSCIDGLLRFQDAVPVLQGWIDITYMSEDGSFRLTKGNKGELLATASMHQFAVSRCPVSGAGCFACRRLAAWPFNPSLHDDPCPA